mgnify:CR=1 FL=1
MIFITLGSQKFQFNRLLRVVDELIENGTITEPVFAQIGHSNYVPVNFEYQCFLDRDEYTLKIDQSDIVITHGGTGAIISAVKKGKKVIAVPRLAEFGEHIDNHQLQIIKQFQELDLICECYDIKKLDEALRKAQTLVYKEYRSNTQMIIKSIMSFIEEKV